MGRGRTFLPLTRNYDDDTSITGSHIQQVEQSRLILQHMGLSAAFTLEISIVSVFSQSPTLLSHSDSACQASLEDPVRNNSKCLQREML